MNTSLVVQDNQETSDYDRNPDFNQAIDYEYGDDEGYIEIAGARMRPSEALFKVDPVAYHMALVDFQQGEIENFKDVVIQKFPTLIAFNLHRADRGYDDDSQRLMCLRDTWESLIYFLYAMITGELRSYNLPIILENNRIRGRDIYSNKLFEKLGVIEKILVFAKDNTYPLESIDLVKVETIEKIRELNRVRNQYSHYAAQSVEQARQLYPEWLQEVISVLKDLQRLQEVTVLRFVGQGRSALQFRGETFIGHYLNRDYSFFDIPQSIIHDCIPHLNDQRILIRMPSSRLFSASPFLHFHPDTNLTRLCYFKDKEGESPDQKYIFEILGVSQPKDFPASNFLTEDSELRSLLLRAASGAITQ